MCDNVCTGEFGEDEIITKCTSIDMTLTNPPGSVHKLHYTMILVGYTSSSPTPTLGYIGYSHESWSPPGPMGWNFDVNMGRTILNQRLPMYSSYSLEFPH